MLVRSNDLTASLFLKREKNGILAFRDSSHNLDAVEIHGVAEYSIDIVRGQP